MEIYNVGDFIKIKINSGEVRFDNEINFTCGEVLNNQENLLTIIIFNHLQIYKDNGILGRWESVGKTIFLNKKYHTEFEIILFGGYSVKCTVEKISRNEICELYKLSSCVAFKKIELLGLGMTVNTFTKTAIIWSNLENLFNYLKSFDTLLGFNLKEDFSIFFKLKNDCSLFDLRKISIDLKEHIYKYFNKRVPVKECFDILFNEFSLINYNPYIWDIVSQSNFKEINESILKKMISLFEGSLVNDSKITIEINSKKEYVRIKKSYIYLSEEDHRLEKIRNEALKKFRKNRFR